MNYYKQIIILIHALIKRRIILQLICTVSIKQQIANKAAKHLQICGLHD